MSATEALPLVPLTLGDPVVTAATIATLNTATRDLTIPWEDLKEKEIN